MLEEKILGLIKTLPKNLRRNLVPAPDSAARATAKLLSPSSTSGSGEVAGFWERLCEVLSEEAKERIAVDDFQLDKLPPHLRMRTEILDDQGKVVQRTRDLASLQAQVVAAPPKVQPTSPSVGTYPWSRTKMTTFDIDRLPESIDVRRAGLLVPIYPTLVVEAGHVGTGIADRLDRARAGIQEGMLQLWVLQEHRELKSQVTHLPKLSQCQLWLASRIPGSALMSALIELMARLAFLENQALIREEAEFTARKKDRLRRIGLAAQEIAKWLPRFAEQFHTAALALEKLPRPALALRQAIQTQLDALLPPDFLRRTPWEWLKEFPRYLQAMAYRMDRWSVPGAAKDQAHQQTIDGFWREYQARLANAGPDAWPQDPKLLEYRWMIEELRVSLFAQPLGTRVTVSPKRLDQWF
jgi:ATP-dependent helicase HrpA